MNVGSPFRLFSRDLDVRILIELSRGHQPLSGREVGVRIGASQAGVRAALDRLVAAGAVSREPVGQTYAHRLNREHVAYPVVLAMRGMRAAVTDAARERIAEWEVAPVHAAFFGSFARADGDAASDLDLLLIHDDDVALTAWEAQLGDLADLRRLTGNHVQILDLPASALEAPEHRPTLETIADDEVPLGSTRLSSLLRKTLRRRGRDQVEDPALRSGEGA